MAITSTTFEGYLEAAITAFAAGDYATARQQAKAARMALTRLPNYGTPEGSNLNYREDEITKILADIDDEERRTSASRGARYTYAGRRNYPV